MSPVSQHGRSGAKVGALRPIMILRLLGLSLKGSSPLAHVAAPSPIPPSSLILSDRSGLVNQKMLFRNRYPEMHSNALSAAMSMRCRLGLSSWITAARRSITGGNTPETAALKERK
jgi:hypothetical protein